MSDDLAVILELVRGIETNINERLSILEDEERRRRGQDWGTPNTLYGWVTTTNPPGQCVRVERGNFWLYVIDAGLLSSIESRGWAEYTLDLRDYISAFADANYYRWVIVVYNPLNVQFWFVYEPDWGDWETAEEAIEDFWLSIENADIDLYGTNLAPWSSDPFWPVCALLIRNNGTTGAVGELENITVDDRELSSILLNDFRPWMNIIHSLAGNGGPQ